ncbi:hypothetical protein [Dongia sp.]|uniref:hypothetical protein n=1 Tax=Dongia sp. TaxID=1977262 RepID=UPI0035AE526A
MVMAMPRAAGQSRPWMAAIAGAMPPERIAWMSAALMLVLLPVCLVLLAIDPRTINGVSVWAKPIKFQLSLALHFATLALLLRLLIPAARPALRLGFILATAAALFEILYITLQSARGRASHFNAETPLEMALYQVMGVGAVAIVIVAMAAGWTIWRQARPEIGPGLRLGACLGLVLGGVATLVTAGALGSGEIAGPTHLVGGIARDAVAAGDAVWRSIAGDAAWRSIASDAGGLPFFGWSQVMGDLRVPHFFATHLMQALPLLGLAADLRLSARRAQLVVWIGAGLGLLLVAATFWQAVLGLPFLTL